jgi:hypothetical protein
MVNRLPATWTSSSYLGCYVDQPSRDLPFLALTSSSMTVEVCLNACFGYQYIGLQDGNQCFCGNTYGSYGVTASMNCNTPCAGNTTEICGSSYTNSVYWGWVTY